MKRYLKRLLKILKRQEIGILPGQIAYFLVLSMIPLVTLIGIIASKFSISIDSFVNTFEGALPQAITDILLPALSSPNFGVGVSMIVGFFIASNATNSIILASNMLFKIEDKGILRNRIKAIFMLLVLITLFFFVVVVMAFGNSILLFLYDFIFKVEVPKVLYNIFLILKYSIGIFVIFVMIKFIFTMAPDGLIPSKKMNKGAIFTTITWVIATFVYSIYINNFANYNIIYSSLSNIVILMIWIYILSYALVIGIAINSDDYLSELKQKK